MNKSYDELEREAYAAGNVGLAKAYARISELEVEKEELQDQIDSTETLENWERLNGPASAYYEFFYECFYRLGAHYPAPSVTSEYDKNVIFEAIERGEEVKA